MTEEKPKRKLTEQFTEQSTPVKILIAVVALCCVGVIIFALAGFGSPDATDTTTSTTDNTESTSNSDNTQTASAKYSEGSYKVGTDIPPGEYYAVPNGAMYVEVSKDSTGELDSIVYNLNSEGNAYITIKEGQYLTINRGELYELKDAPFTKEQNGILPEGMYKVGKDLPAGEYKVVSTDSYDAYVEVASNSYHILDSIITNDNFSGQKYITVSDGQYLTLTRCELQLK